MRPSGGAGPAAVASAADGTTTHPEGPGARDVQRRLHEEYPDARCELDHRNPYELLAATILSAQCTDVRVNMVTPSLFARYPTPEDLAVAEPADVEELVRSTGLLQEQDAGLIGMANALVERFDGEVPVGHEGPRERARRGAQDGQRRAHRWRWTCRGCPSTPTWGACRCGWGSRPRPTR